MTRAFESWDPVQFTETVLECCIMRTTDSYLHIALPNDGGDVLLDLTPCGRVRSYISGCRQRILIDGGGASTLVVVT